MFDSGGSSGVLRDELGVLPPGDVLKCALALARNEREARRVLLSRLPTLEHARLGGHTGGNLLLSMMERYSGDFLAAVDGLRALLGCRGRVWPVSVEQASRLRRVRRRLGDARRSRGRRRAVVRPRSSAHLARAAGRRSIRGRRSAIAQFDAVIIGPGSFYTSLMPIFLVRGVAEAIGTMRRAGHPRRESADRRTRHGGLHGRRRRRADRGRHRPPRRRRHHQHRAGRRRKCSALRARAQGAAGQSATCRRTARSSAASSGRATSRATIACASPTRCGACSRDVCSARPENLEQPEQVRNCMKALTLLPAAVVFALLLGAAGPKAAVAIRLAMFGSSAIRWPRRSRRCPRIRMGDRPGWRRTAPSV